MKGHGILLRFIIVNTGLIHRNKLEIYKLFFFPQTKNTICKRKEEKAIIFVSINYKISDLLIWTLASL